MDRKEAQLLLNKYVIIDEKGDGVYYGKLLEIIAEPRKPWKGLVKITGIASFPEQNHFPTVQVPIYTIGQKVVALGSKIFKATRSEMRSDRQTLQTELLKWAEKLNQEQQNVREQLLKLINYADEASLKEDVISQLQQYLIAETEAERYYFYDVVVQEQQYLLVNGENNQTLPLEGCPFQFELFKDRVWQKGHYIENGLFKLIDGNTNERLKQGDQIRLEKKQLDPYELLLKELEQPAFDSLEKSLQHFNIKHEHLVSCHNTLLSQLVNENKQQKFSGTNFILYERNDEVISVQHHYERVLKEVGNDETYDRFELTSSSGKRYIITYTNEVSRRSNKNN